MLITVACGGVLWREAAIFLQVKIMKRRRIRWAGPVVKIMWTRTYVWTEKTSRKMTPGKTKVFWADTITIDLRDMFGWEVDESGLGPYSARVSDILVNSAEILVSYSKELISPATFRRSTGLNRFSASVVKFAAPLASISRSLTHTKRIIS